MESVGNMYCQVCQKSYQSSDTSPRCLTCHHIFCGTCISSLITTTIKCPKCHSTINVLTAEEIDSINSSILKSSSNSSSTSTIAKDTRGETSSSAEQEPKIEQENFPVVVSSDFSEPYDSQYPIVLVQECDSTENSNSSQETETTNQFCCDSLEKHISNHLFPPEAVHFIDEERSARADHESPKSSSNSDKDSGKNLLPDSPDIFKLEPSFKLMVDENIRVLAKNFSHEQIQNHLDIENESTKDSLIVHRSNSRDFDHIPMIPEVREGLSIDVNFKETKDHELQRFADQIQILHEVLETVDDAILTLKVEQEHHESTKENLIQMIKEEEEKVLANNLKIEEALKNKSLVQQVTETLRETEEAVGKVQSVDTLKVTLEKTSDSMTVAEDLGTKIELHYMQFLLSRNVQKPEYLERMIDVGVQVFAEHIVNGERRWARVSLLNSLIHVHALRAESPPSLCRILPWSCLQGMVSQDKTSTFLDLAVAGKNQGRVYFSMFGDTPRAQQFVMLSSGEHRYCYRSIKMKQLGNQDQPGEYVSFHGPKNAKGSPVRSAVPGINQGGVYTRRKTSGLLAGAALSHRQKTLFVVYLRPDPDEDTTGAFGEVTKGLEILSKVSRHDPLHEVEIEDCGLVIPLISSTS